MIQPVVDGTHLVVLVAVMTPIPSKSIETTERIGKLCVGGDWACAHGDFAALRHVALELEDFAPEPVHCELAQLAVACITEPERAAALWERLKSDLYREPAP